MQPSARLAATIEILDSIEAAIASRGLPADRLVADYFRARRFAGSKDKRAISDHVYAVLRSREWLLWGLAHIGADISARALFIAHLVRHDSAQLALFAADDQFAPDALSDEEQHIITQLAALDWTQAPGDARSDVPSWASAGLRKRFGPAFEQAAMALQGTAPLDVRVNGLKADGFNIKLNISISSEDIEKNKYSEFGYRIKARLNLPSEKAYRDGMLEVQDEAAQVAAALVATAPGQQVVDLCAGGGGKSLAVAAVMENRGQIHAFDISGKRLADFRTRLQRAGYRNIQVTRIGREAAARSSAFAGLSGKADRVIVDTPCSGTGTWRRSPDLRWRFDGESLAELHKTQAGLLREAATLAKPGGRVVYMTCSLLPSENEDIIQGFMAEAGEGWQLLDYRDIWADVLKSVVPDTLSLEPKCLQLAPHSHDTDGFFVAVLERRLIS